MKKIIALVLCIAMCASLVCIPVSAASGTLTREEELAEALKSLGLFKGVSETDFALDRAPTRVEALVMLIRVLGKESDALAKGGRHPFLDVPQWADKYVGYAYENNLTNGVSATEFGSQSDASSAMYITFVLRALGYSDADGDFTWNYPYALALKTGIMEEGPELYKFLRADVVLVSYAALQAEVKGSGKTLAESLIEAGVFTKEQYEKIRPEEAPATDSAVQETQKDTILRTWIEENSNVEDFGAPTVGANFVVGEDEATFFISYFEEISGFIVTVDYTFPESDASEIMAMLVFSEASEKVDLGYRFFAKKSDTAPLIKETLSATKSEICEEMKKLFPEDSAAKADPAHEANANALWYAAAKFVDNIIATSLSGSGLTGISDFGFENVAE